MGRNKAVFFDMDGVIIDGEDVSAGDIIVTCLGDPGGKICELQKGDLAFDGVLHVEQVVEYFSW